MPRPMKVTKDVTVLCLPPKSFFFDPDFESTLLWYDEGGRPKKHVPSKQLPSGEWAYCLSAKRFDPPLKGDRLDTHLAEIALMKGRK